MPPPTGSVTVCPAFSASVNLVSSLAIFAAFACLALGVKGLPSDVTPLAKSSFCFSMSAFKASVVGALTAVSGCSKISNVDGVALGAAA